MGMAERIKERRKALGYTQTELGLKLGLQASAIAKYENGRVKNMKRSVIANMAKVLECSPAYLMGLEDEETFISLQNIYPIELKRFPLVGEIACGKPKYANEDRESYIMAGTDIKADFCLKASGDSMVGARILDGDIVFIRKQEMVNNGEIAAVVVNNDNEATLKRLFYYKEKSLLILKAENPTYEDLIFQGEELNEVHILGKAVAFQSDVK
jgi:repressor LexA